MSSTDTLQSLILGCNKQIPINPLVTYEELIGHVPQCNIELVNTITIGPDMLGQFNTHLIMSWMDYLHTLVQSGKKPLNRQVQGFVINNIMS